MFDTPISTSDETKWRALLDLVQPLAPKAAVYALTLGTVVISGYAGISPMIRPLVEAAGAVGINLVSDWIDRRLQGKEVSTAELQRQIDQIITQNDLAPLLTTHDFYDAMRQLVRHLELQSRQQSTEILQRLDSLQALPDQVSGQAPRVFISYARSDGETIATKLRQQLIGAGIPIWQDRIGMEGGRDWWQQIEAAITQVEFMVLVMTPAAMQSATVRHEWRKARQEGICVYPVKGAPNLDFASLPRWMRDSHFYDLGFDPDHFYHGPEWAKFLNDLNTRCEIPRVPFMCEDLPSDFVARRAELKALVDQLLDETREEPVAITAALKGAGGYGKTTLACAICHDERIQQAFDDGILWVKLGERVDNLVGKVDDLVYVLSGKHSNASSLETVTSELIRLLEDRDLLIVIDDVWHAADLKPFLQGGKRCARLITTRNADVLPPETLPHRVLVDAMHPTEAYLLISAGLREANTHAARISKLAARLGEWPLLLRLANGAICNRISFSEQSLSDALDYVERALDKRGLTAFDQRDASSEHRDRAVSATMAISLDQLTPEEQERYSELAIFPEDVDIPLVTVETLWSATGDYDDFDTEQLCEQLANLSLVLRLDLQTRTIRLHDVVRAFLILHIDNWSPRRRSANEISIEGHLSESKTLKTIHARFLDAYGISRWAELPKNEQYLWDWLGYHLIAADRGVDFAHTLLDLSYVALKVYLRGAAAVESI